MKSLVELKKQKWGRETLERNAIIAQDVQIWQKTICFDCLHPLNLIVRKCFLLHKSWIPGITAKTSSWNRKKEGENFLKSVSFRNITQCKVIVYQFFIIISFGPQDLKIQARLHSLSSPEAQEVRWVCQLVQGNVRAGVRGLLLPLGAILSSHHTA